MILYIVRHGETIENANDICMGHSQGQLTDKGIDEAKALAERLKDIHFDAVYCSDLKRAKDTLKKIRLFHKDTPVSFTPALRERSRGIWEGKTHTELNKYVADNNLDYGEWTPEGGENRQDMKDRVFALLEKAIKDHKNKTVLFVTHGGPIYMILKHFFNTKEPYIHSKNTGLSIIDFSNEKPKLISMNCIKHLNSGV